MIRSNMLVCCTGLGIYKSKSFFILLKRIHFISYYFLLFLSITVIIHINLNIAIQKSNHVRKIIFFYDNIGINRINYVSIFLFSHLIYYTNNCEIKFH